jgi:hypothetical protein
MTTKMAMFNPRSPASVLLCFLAAGLLPLAGQAQSTDSNLHGHPHSGIVGQVFLTGYCPAIRPGLNCSPRPLPSTVEVRSERGRVIGQFTTDDQAMFRVELRPGDYLLFAVDPPMGLSPPVEVTVVPGQFTELAAYFDAGVR